MANKKKQSIFTLKELVGYILFFSIEKMLPWRRSLSNVSGVRLRRLKCPVGVAAVAVCQVLLVGAEGSRAGGQWEDRLGTCLTTRETPAHLGQVSSKTGARSAERLDTGVSQTEQSIPSTWVVIRPSSQFHQNLRHNQFDGRSKLCAKLKPATTTIGAPMSYNEN